MPYEHFSITNLHVLKKKTDATNHLLGFKICILVAMKCYSLLCFSFRNRHFNALNSSTAQIQNLVKHVKL